MAEVRSGKCELCNTRYWKKPHACLIKISNGVSCRSLGWNAALPDGVILSQIWEDLAFWKSSGIFWRFWSFSGFLGLVLSDFLQKKLAVLAFFWLFSACLSRKWAY
jgi:hypothetical protein